jgi:hypothetical protein
MTDQYKVPKHIRENEIIFCYRYSEEHRNFHSNIFLPSSFQSPDLKTEDDFMQIWMNFSYFPFDNYPAFSIIRPWRGHCEQFARVMLQFMRWCDKRQTWDGTQIKSFDMIMPDREVITGSFWHPANSSEHDWYRAWYSLIGHPDFIGVEVSGNIDFIEYMKKKFLLSVAFYDLSELLRSEERLIVNSGIDKKMKKIGKKIKKMT